MACIVNACSTSLIAAGLFAHISWGAKRLSDQPLRCLFHEPLWILHRCLMHWSDLQIDHFMVLALRNNVVAIALTAVLEPVSALANSSGDLHSVTLLSRLREESLGLVLSFCFEMFSRTQTRHSDFSGSMHLLHDVKLFERLTHFTVCKHTIIHSRFTALGLALILWCCLMFGCSMSEKDCAQLKGRLGVFMIRFENEPIFFLYGIRCAAEDVLSELLATPLYLFRMIAGDRLS